MGKAEYSEKITGTTKSFFWNMAWMLKSFAAAQQAGIAKPVYEKRIGTKKIPGNQ